MTEHPIIFKTVMVRAILEGRKTVTRRVIKNPGRLDGLMLEGEAPDWCPYGKIGDYLWVRETWRYVLVNPNMPNGRFVTVQFKNFGVLPWFKNWREVYKGVADGEKWVDEGAMNNFGKWRPSIHMPRKFSRITLEVTDVRVERVQEITKEGAKAEGLYNLMIEDVPVVVKFRQLWNSINAKRGYSWDSNPWVWVVEFKLINKEATDEAN